MATENFTTYTETDPGGKITVTSSKVDVATLLDSEVSRVYKDAGVNHFAGDYEHLVTVYCSSATVTGLSNVVWAVANVSNGDVALNGFGNDANWLRMYEETGSTASLYLQENDGGSSYTDTNTSLSLSTPYYLKIKRDESIGTYGTLYCYIYSDSGRTSLVDTLSITLHTSKKDYQYVYAHAGWNSEAGSYSWTGYTENLDLQEGATSSIKTINGLAYASVKTINGLAIASVKTVNGLA